MKLQTKNRIAGFTLIELMIAMAVTLILLYAAVQVFRDATYSNQLVVQAADMSDNLRAGVNLIQQDLQQAGAGIPVGGISIPFTPDSSGCGTTTLINRPKLSGNTTFPKCNATLPAVEPGNDLGPSVTVPDATAGIPQNADGLTDEITMLYEDNTLKLDNLPVNDASKCPNGSVTVSGTTLTVKFDPACLSLTGGGITIQKGDLILLENPNGNTLVCVTDISTTNNTLTFAASSGSGATLTDPFGLNGRNTKDTSGTIAQMASTGCTTGVNSCFPSVLATRVWMITYYLDNVTSPPFVRLVRQLNMPPEYPPQAVGETLENLQFTYNFVDGISNPSNQPTVPAGNSESQIRSVNVYLAARSSYNVHQGNNTSFARNNLMTQVSLRSMAFVDRYN